MAVLSADGAGFNRSLMLKNTLEGVLLLLSRLVAGAGFEPTTFGL